MGQARPCSLSSFPNLGHVQCTYASTRLLLVPLGIWEWQLRGFWPFGRRPSSQVQAPGEEDDTSTTNRKKKKSLNRLRLPITAAEAVSTRVPSGYSSPACGQRGSGVWPANNNTKQQEVARFDARADYIRLLLAPTEQQGSLHRTP